MHYQGQERRRHRVFVTDNTEYHMRDNLCVAVRNTKTGEWKIGHQAIGSALVGSLRSSRFGSFSMRETLEPDVGERLCFTGDLLTTPIRGVRRPTMNTVDGYRHAISA